MNKAIRDKATPDGMTDKEKEIWRDGYAHGLQRGEKVGYYGDFTDMLAKEDAKELEGG